jgi:hypothetical protein
MGLTVDRFLPVRVSTDIIRIHFIPFPVSHYCRNFYFHILVPAVSIGRDLVYHRQQIRHKKISLFEPALVLFFIVVTILLLFIGTFPVVMMRFCVIIPYLLRCFRSTVFQFYLPSLLNYLFYYLACPYLSVMP